MIGGEHKWKKKTQFYEGIWINNKMSIYGRMILHNGDVYVGEIEKGLRHGKGRFIWANGNYYEGRWKDGFQDGKGLFYHAEYLQTFVGLFHQGKIDLEFYNNQNNNPSEMLGNQFSESMTTFYIYDENNIKLSMEKAKLSNIFNYLEKIYLY